jgi:hypothetical protein
VAAGVETKARAWARLGLPLRRPGARLLSEVTVWAMRITKHFVCPVEQFGAGFLAHRVKAEGAAGSWGFLWWVPLTGLGC